MGPGIHTAGWPESGRIAGVCAYVCATGHDCVLWSGPVSFEFSLPYTSPLSEVTWCLHWSQHT